MIIYYRAINDESLPEGYKTLIFITNAGVLPFYFFFLSQSSAFTKKSPVLGSLQGTEDLFVNNGNIFIAILSGEENGILVWRIRRD